MITIPTILHLKETPVHFYCVNISFGKCIKVGAEYELQPQFPRLERAKKFSGMFHKQLLTLNSHIENGKYDGAGVVVKSTLKKGMLVVEEEEMLVVEEGEMLVMEKEEMLVVEEEEMLVVEEEEMLVVEEEEMLVMEKGGKQWSAQCSTKNTNYDTISPAKTSQATIINIKHLHNNDPK